MTSVLSSQQLEEIRQSFNAIDVNGDGRLSVHELMKAQQALGLNPTTEETKKMIAEVDSNKSGFIEMNEYLELMAERYGALEYEEEMMRAAFLHFDRDNSGFLDKSQLFNYLTRCGEKLSAEEFERVLDDIDSDGDGKIDLKGPQLPCTSWLLVNVSSSEGRHHTIMTGTELFC